VIRTTSGRSVRGAAVSFPPGSRDSHVRIEALPDVASARAIDVAEAFRDVPGLALLESARPGRNARWTYLTADPVAVLDAPSPGGDPFAVARRLLARLDGGEATAPFMPEPPDLKSGLVVTEVWSGYDAEPYIGEA